MRTAILFILVCRPYVLMAQEHAAKIEKLHQGPKAYNAMLENPQRDAEQKPDEVIAALKSGEILADTGAGSGYSAFRFARSAGEKGRIYAVDINPEMIAN